MMDLLLCRNCRTELLPAAMDCSHCGCHLPFSCAVCQESVGDVRPVGGDYPLTDDGKPLCPAHARSLCDHCGKAFDHDTLTLRVVSWQDIGNGQVIPVQGGFCRACNASHIDPPQRVKRALGCLGGVIAAIFGLCTGRT